jgi:ribonuclease P protein component
MTLFVGVQPPETGARAAFVTPKTVGSAVVRNRLRRRMREIYRRHLAVLLENRQVIWSARTAAAKMDFDDLKEVMVALGSKSV